jgi:undecaprenyl-diphosphatase
MDLSPRWKKSRFPKVARVDHAVAQLVLQLHQPRITQFLRFISLMGEGKSWLVMVLGLDLLNRLGAFNMTGASSFFNATLAALFAWGISTGLKKLIRRERPFQALSSTIISLYPSPHFDSFPSSHTAASFAFFFALFLMGHSLAWPVGLWAFLVAFSRIYLGVHFFSDILGGMVVAAIGVALYFYLPF